MGGNVVGRHENEAQVLTVATDGARLTLAAGIKAEIRTAAETELPRRPAGRSFTRGPN